MQINQLKLIIFALKAVISITSLYLVSRSISWSEVGEVLKHARYSLVIFALIVFWAAQFFSTLRFVYISRVLGGGLNFSTALSAHFLGLWFNQVMPTSLGGDTVKVGILSKPLGLSVAIRSTLLDRLSGLMLLLLATIVLLPLYVNRFPLNPELIMFFGSVAVCGLLSVFICTWVLHRISVVCTLGPRLQKIIQIFSDVCEFKKGPALWDQIWTSSIVHFSGIVTYSLVGLALGINVDPINFLLIVPIIFIIALLPISFGGWGLREVGAVWLFGMAGIDSSSALAMSVCYGLLLVLAGLPGLVLFIRGNRYENSAK